MAASTRRAFLQHLVAIPTACVALTRSSAGQGLGQFGAEGPAPCNVDEKPTPAVPPGPEYKANAPQRASLVEPGVVGEKIVLTGTVSGVTCGPIKRARVEFWQPDGTGVYDTAGFRLRGQQFTDANGRFRLETIMPGATSRRAPHVHVKVQPPGKPAFTTEIFFADQPQNTKDPQF